MSFVYKWLARRLTEFENHRCVWIGQIVRLVLVDVEEAAMAGRSPQFLVGFPPLPPPSLCYVHLPCRYETDFEDSLVTKT